MIVKENQIEMVQESLEEKIVALGKRYKKEQRQENRKRILSNKLIMTGSIMLLFIMLLALLTPFLAKHDPLLVNPINRLQPPSSEYWFGTDNLGRDIFSRVLHGTQTSVMIGFLVACFSGVVGTVVGLISAYYKGLDNILMRIMDGIMAIPEILLAIALMAALGPSSQNLIIALSIIFIPTIARTIRSAALSVKQIPFIEALKASGAKSSRIIFLHILPNCISPLLVQITFVFAYAIIVEASLSFLGLGTPPPAPSWGSILEEGTFLVNVAWWMTLFPGLAIMITVVSLNLLGDGIRDFLDPHSN